MVHVSASFVEIFQQKHILTIVSIKRLSNDDCEDKKMIESLFGIIHYLHKIFHICKNPYSMRCICMFVYQGVRNLLAKVCYLLNK